MSDATLIQATAVDDSQRPRLGFVGVGWIGRHRLQSVAKCGAAEVAAICDPSDDAVSTAKTLAPESHHAESFDDILAMDLDGVVIATPNSLHVPQTIAALEAGLPVFCQKPLARTAAEAERVVETARRMDLPLGLDLSYRHTDAMRRVREAVQDGEIGDVFAVDAVFHNAYGPDKAWFHDPALSGGGCVLDLGIHLVDLAMWTLDFPDVRGVRSDLFAKGRRLEPPIEEVETHALAQVELSMGTILNLTCSWNTHAGCDAVIGMRFHGTEGCLEMRNQNGSFFDFMVERFRGREREVVAEPPDDWGGRAIVDWAERVARREGFSDEALRFVDLARILDGVYGR